MDLSSLEVLVVFSVKLYIFYFEKMYRNLVAFSK